MSPKIFFWIAACVADAPAANSNGIKTLLTNGLSIFFIKGKSVFSNGPKRLPKNPLDSPILENCFFDFILSDEPFEKDLRILETYVLGNNNLCRK